MRRRKSYVVYVEGNLVVAEPILTAQMMNNMVALMGSVGLRVIYYVEVVIFYVEKYVA